MTSRLAFGATVFGATVAAMAAVSLKGIEGRLNAAAKFPKA